jgi:Domain of Unknown Function (DUF1206)
MPHPLRATKRVRAGEWVERAGMAGLVARGIVYLIVAALAVALATGDRAEETDQQGALAELAERPFGKVLLVVLVAGFCCYGAWRLARSVRGEGGEEPDAGQRLVDLAKAVLYLGLAVSTVNLLTDGPSTGSGATGGGGAEGVTARLMAEQSWGRWAVGLLGVAVIAFGLWQVYRGVSQRFRKRLEESIEPGHDATIVLGVVGHAARGVVIVMIGWLFVRAARNFDPAQPVGVDAALREVLHAPAGPLLGVVVAVGLGAFGLYSFGEARYRQIS